MRSPADDSGTVTAELAAAIPALLVLLVVCVGALAALTERAVLIDGAADAARAVARGEPPLVIDVPPGKAGVAEYMRKETRFRMVERQDPGRFWQLAAAAADHAARRVALYDQMSHIVLPKPTPASSPVTVEANGAAKEAGA